MGRKTTWICFIAKLLLWVDLLEKQNKKKNLFVSQMVSTLVSKRFVEALVDFYFSLPDFVVRISLLSLCS